MDFQTTLRDRYGLALNEQQWEAVRAVDGPMLLLAVPGSGKTTVITARCAYMALCRGIEPDTILTLTFNRAAQRDMESRFRRVFGADVAAPMRFSTIHSFCYSVLCAYGKLVGRRVPRVIDAERPAALRRLYAEANGGEYLPDDRLEELSNLIGYVKNSMMTDGEIASGKFSVPNFSHVFSAYERYKDENGCMDYDDMPDKALAVFRVRPQILEGFRRQYRYVNVDEAQDTSRLQHAVIRLLAAPRNNLFMVGDEDQSIYRFRAADPGYLLDFAKVYPDARVLYMERNYRSTHRIVEAAGRLIRRNTMRHDKAMNTGNEVGMPVEAVTLGDNGELGGYVAGKAGGEPGKWAVLYRENASAAPLVDALDRAGVPFAVRERSLGLFDHWVVRDLLAFLALGHNPGDAEALRQIYFKLNAYITRDAFGRVSDVLGRMGGGNAFDVLLQIPELKGRSTARLERLRADFARLPGMAPPAALKHVLETIGYGEYLKRSSGGGYYLESLLHAAQSLQAIASRTESYGELLARIAELPGILRRAGENGGRDAVTLSTVHSAKGLEFDGVLVVDLFDGRFPSAAAIAEAEEGKKDGMEEERRLFYVAVTRARRHVELVTARGIFGGRVKPSRFIRELLPPAIRRAPAKPARREPEPDRDAPPISPGMEVQHKSFGRGSVVACDEGRGLVAVHFPKLGVKTISAAFCAAAKQRNRRDERFEP